MLEAMLVFHVLICLFIVGVVLLQASQQANIGSMFGGGASQTVFGSGTQSALGKATTVAAILFFSTCLMISFIVEKERSVIKRSEVTFQQPIEEKVTPPGEPTTIPEAGGQPLVPQNAPPAEP